LIESTHHKHELPIPFFEQFETIFEDDELIVINKPAGVPIHWGHKHQKSSIVGLYENLFDIKLFVIHRIDRLTTGTLLLAKTKAAAKKWTRKFANREVSKYYLARVSGKFPDGIRTVEAPMRPSQSREYMEISPEGKPACTQIVRLSHLVDLNESIVQCFPQTGRTHQIRLHLQHIGFHISNDPIYAPDIDSCHLIPIDFNSIPDRDHVDNMCYVCDDLDGWRQREWHANYFHRGLYLHAAEYWSDGFRFTSPTPDWAEGVEPLPNLDAFESSI